MNSPLKKTGGVSWVSRPLLIGAAACLAAMLPLSGLAQKESPPAAQGASPTSLSGARYLESCQNASADGTPIAGCPGTLRGTDIEQLKQEALRTKNPQLFTMLGDAYQSNRAGQSDLGQAYRWYLLAAVRGDPEAMVRLSEMYKTGKGTAQDKVKALGYARLTQKLAPEGSAAAREAAQTVRSLGGKMADREVAMAEQFAGDLEQELAGRPGTLVSGNAGMPPAPGLDGRTLPGMGAASITSGAAEPSSNRPQGPAPAAAQPPLPGAGLADQPNVPGLSGAMAPPAPPEALVAPPLAKTPNPSPERRSGQPGASVPAEAPRPE